MTAIDELLANARRYEADFTSGGLAASPSRRVAVLACMDSRIDLFALLGLALGEAHIIRNAGGVVTEDAIRSLTLSQRLLGTTEIMLIHHTGCGMLMFREDEVKAEIEADTGVRPPFALEAFADLDGDVRQSIARIRSSPFIPHRESVRGFVFDVDSGRLREVPA